MKCLCSFSGPDPNCPEHGIAASNAREDQYWSDPVRADEWAASLNGAWP